MHRRIGFWLVSALVANPTGSALAGISKHAVKQTVEEFDAAPRAARSAADLLPLSYAEYRSLSYAISLPRRFICSRSFREKWAWCRCG